MLRKLKKTAPYLSAVIFLLAVTGAVWGDGHKKNRHAKHYQSAEYKDKGHEASGQTAAWLLPAANLTAAISILLKSVKRFLPIEARTKTSIAKFNQLQKKYLMRWHYILNAAAFGVALFHFSLSRCRASPLPEWGLAALGIMTFLGLMVKFRTPAGHGRKLFRRLHTSSVSFMLLTFLIVFGHMIID